MYNDQYIFFDYSYFLLLNTSNHIFQTYAHTI
uniref:Uncharacterized protein n=1 Tax=viral metagenome TaxID=1070528 RepID=A0A6C0EBY4_9ZZZZ